MWADTLIDGGPHTVFRRRSDRGEAVVRRINFDGCTATAGFQINGELHLLTLKSSRKIVEPESWGDVWLLFALLPAMRLNTNIRLEGCGISAHLAETINLLQTQIKKWFPDFYCVSINTSVTSESLPTKEKVASLFTGGVDSWFSLIAENPDEFIYVIDTHNEPPLISQMMKRLIEEAGTATGKKTLLIESNIRSVVDKYCEWGLHFHGLFFSGVGGLVSGQYSKVIIPVGYWQGIRDDTGWGMHPILEPLLPAGNSHIYFHGGNFRRFDKVRAIARSRAALSQLRVCWQSTKELNCSECEKCLRTMVVLDILGVGSLATSFSWPLNLAALGELHLAGEHEKAWWRENYAGAIEYGRTDLAEVMEIYIHNA